MAAAAAIKAAANPLNTNTGFLFMKGPGIFVLFSRFLLVKPGICIV
jgi:hypothetical protein